MFLKPRTQVDPVLTDVPLNFGEHTTPECGVFRLPRGARRASAAGFAQPRAPAPLHGHTFSATTTAFVRSATVCIRGLLHSSAYVPKTTPTRALAVFVQLFWRFCKNPGLFWRGFCEVDCGRLPWHVRIQVKNASVGIGRSAYLFMDGQEFSRLCVNCTYLSCAYTVLKHRHRKTEGRCSPIRWM